MIDNGYRPSAKPYPHFGVGSHLLSVEQFDRDALTQLFALADTMQPVAQSRLTTDVLAGAVLANLFFEASTRTRLSFGSAFSRLGGSVIDTTGFTFSSMAKGESIYDTSRVVSGYSDVVVVRHPEVGSVAEFAAATNVPVINGGDGAGEHPTQALLDVYTITREFRQSSRSIDGSRVTILGDLRFGRTVHSLLRLLSLYDDLKLALYAPDVLQLPEAIAEICRRRGHSIKVCNSMAEALDSADVLYTTRIQTERLGELSVPGDPARQVTRRLVDQLCTPHVIVMHPLPRDSREGAYDLSTDLNGDPRLAIFRQTDNGIAIRMAIFAQLLGVKVSASELQPVRWWTPASVGAEDPVAPVGRERP